jgi:hypothetical protein
LCPVCPIRKCPVIPGSERSWKILATWMVLCAIAPKKLLEARIIRVNSAGCVTVVSDMASGDIEVSDPGVWMAGLTRTGQGCATATMRGFVSHSKFGQPSR